MWAKIDAPPSLGGEYLQRLKGLEEQREFLCNTVKNTLENHDLVWFEGKYGQSGRALDAEARKTQAIWIREARDLTDRMLPWYAAGLGRKEYLADYDYWGKRPEIGRAHV